MEQPDKPHAARGRRFTRRAFLRGSAAVAGAVAIGGALDAFLVEPHWLRVTHTSIVLPRWPAVWNGLRIALLADIHRGRWVNLDHVRRMVETTNAQKPDLIALAGDFVSRLDAIGPDYGRLLGKLRARDGVYAVLGNHDHWTNAAAVGKMLTDADILLLSNAHHLLRRDGQILAVAGVGDLWEGRPSHARALQGVPPHAPRLLLCHNPDYAELMPAEPRVDLMLCGHTHGGQVNLPLLGRPRLPIQHHQYAAGLVDGPHCPVYVTVGAGLIGPPVRFRCRPEVALLTVGGY